MTSRPTDNLMAKWFRRIFSLHKIHPRNWYQWLRWGCIMRVPNDEEMAWARAAFDQWQKEEPDGSSQKTNPNGGR